MIDKPPEEESRLDPVDVDMEEKLLSNRAKSRQEQELRQVKDQPVFSNGEKRKHELLPPKTVPDQSNDLANEKRNPQISDISIDPSNRPFRRVTRNMHRNDRESSPLVGPGNSVPFDIGPEWSNPVVFGTGKKRAIVDHEDLHRLNDSEFLNDNLIEFYLNWLQDKNPVEENQVHFFSTHFYSAL